MSRKWNRMSRLDHVSKIALVGVIWLGGCTNGPLPFVPDSPWQSQLIVQGQKFIERRACSQCHQSPDPTDGVLTGQRTTLPGTLVFGPNLTPDSETGIGGWNESVILRAIRAGVDDTGSPLCPTMPHFSGMGDEEGSAIVAYLKSLSAVSHAVPPSVCPPIKPGATDAGQPD